MGASLVHRLPDQLPRPVADAGRLGVSIDHTTLFRWVQSYAAALEQRIRRHLRQIIDCLLSARRDAAAAKRFFRKALAQPYTVNPRTITVDKNPAYPRATIDMKRREIVALLAAAAVQILEQHHRAGPPADQMAGAAGARLRQLTNCQANRGRP